MTRRWARVLLAAAVVAAGCTSESTGADDAADGPPSSLVATAGCDDVVRTFVGRERPMPGGHVQVDVFPITGNDEVVDAAECVTVRDDADGVRFESAAVNRATDRRLISVLIDPGRNDADQEAAAAVVEELGAAYADADVALYHWGPSDDPAAVSVPLVDLETEWLVATDPSTVDDGWRQGRFELSGAFAGIGPGTVVWPAPVDPSAPVFGRAAFDVFHESTAGAALVIDHTHGVRVWVNGAEVMSSNITAAGAVADSGPGRRRAQATVGAEVLQAGTNIVAVEMRRSANGDAPEVDLRLTSSDGRVVPAAPLAPTQRGALVGGDVVRALPLTTETPGRIDEALAAVVEDLERTHDDETDALRALVVVAPGTAAPEVDVPGRTDAVLVWVGDGGRPESFDLVTDLGSGDDVLETISRRLDVVAASRLVVGVCSQGAEFEAEIEVGRVNLSTNLEAPPPETIPAECDPAGATVDDLAPVDEIDMVLDAEEQTTFTDRLVENDKTPFRASLDLGDDWGPAPAEVSLRGQSSLECERKSYSVNLDQGHRRHVAEETAFDEFFLLSMCLDQGYVRTATMLSVLADQGLFPAASRLVHLRIDGVSAGIHLLVEPPEEALQDRQPGLRGVVRRALDTSFQESSVEYSAVARDDIVFEDYEDTIVAAEAGGSSVVGAVAEHLDLDAYLRWLAIMSATDNGDYVDEVFFAGVGVTDGATVSPYWTPMGWDPDDIFTPCHFDDFQFVDPSGLSTCAESRLDNALLGTDAGYGAFVAALEEVVGWFTPEVFAAELARTRARLAELIDDDAAAAMPELAAVSAVDTSTAAGFMDAVDGEIAALESMFEARRDALVTGLAALSGDDQPTAPAALDVGVPGRVILGRPYPMLISAVGADGVDRGRTGEIAVTGTDQDTVPLRRGMAVATVSAGGTGPVTIDGTEVAEPVVVAAADALAPAVIDAVEQWGPDEVVAVEEPLVVIGDGRLEIRPGTTVVVAPGVNIDVEDGGALVAEGTADAPVFFTDADPAAPWGGVRSVGGTIDVSHTMFTGGGGDPTRSFGHSDSQPLLMAGAESDLAVVDSLVADSAAKAFGADGASVDIRRTVVTRTDTGGELLDSTFSVAESWFIDFPQIEAPAADDDNDALYIGATSAPSRIADSVFIGGIDDGIDHAGADVVIERVWIEGFSHECVATSEGGSVDISDSVLTACEHGLEVGYGAPEVVGERLLLLANGTALRYGDDFVFQPATGTLALSDSLFVDNVAGLLLTAPPVELSVSSSVSDDPGDDIAGVELGSPELDAQFRWPGGPGIETGW